MRHRVLRRDKCTGDAGRARTAIGLQHVAVQVDGALAEFFEVKHRPHGSSDQTLDFLGAARLFAARCLAVAAGVGSAGQHAVFSCDPAFARTFFVAGDFFFYRRGTKHLGVAKLDQYRAFGVHGVVTGDAHRAQLVSGAGVAGFWENSGHK